ncbi:hypothetical protein [Pseudomonas veronii]
MQRLDGRVCGLEHPHPAALRVHLPRQAVVGVVNVEKPAAAVDGGVRGQEHPMHAGRADKASESVKG